MSDRTAVWLAGIWLALVVLVSLSASALTAHDPYDPAGPTLAPPGGRFPLGTDALGRDLWSRLAYGGRLSLGASLLASGLTVLLGGSLGLLAAALGGWVERGVLWLANSMLAIPGLLLAMLLVAGMGPGMPTVILAVAIGGTPGYARLSRGLFAALREMGYVAAAAALGAGRFWLAWRHVLPNARDHLISLATTSFAWAFLGTTTLTFLGLTGEPALPEWGALLNAGRLHLVQAPRLVILPGVLITLTILSVHRLGDWLSRRIAT